jgi:phosphatidyl-myo-inositol dimannoside synthase
LLPTKNGPHEVNSGFEERPRIVLLAEAFPPIVGGSARWFWEAYQRVTSSEVCILTDDCPGGREFDATHELNVRRIPLSLSESGTFWLRGMRGYAGIVRRLLAVHRESPLTMLHCARTITEGWAGWLFSKLTGVPYLVFVHGEDVNYTPGISSFGLMSSRQHRWMARRVLRGAHRLLANSENSRRILETVWSVPPERIRVVHPGFDAQRFVPAEPSEQVRAALGWSGRQVLLTVGRLQLRKGHDMLIRALPELRRTHPHILYAIAGSGEELSRLRDLAAELNVADSVQFLTQVADDQLVQMYQQCDLFVLPNRTVGHDIEGFGMVLVEAQACGKPVIAGDSGGTRETMRVPETGRIVRCEGGPELAATIRELLDDPAGRMKMGAAAREWACQFDWAAVVRCMESVFADQE